MCRLIALSHAPQCVQLLGEWVEGRIFVCVILVMNIYFQPQLLFDLQSDFGGNSNIHTQNLYAYGMFPPYFGVSVVSPLAYMYHLHGLKGLAAVCT